MTDAMDPGPPGPNPPPSDSGAPAEGGAPPEQVPLPKRKERPGARLPDDVVAGGDLKAGSVREDVRRKKERQSMTRVWLILGLVAGVGLLGALYVFTGRRKEQQGPIAQERAATNDVAETTVRDSSAAGIGADPMAGLAPIGVPAAPSVADSTRVANTGAGVTGSVVQAGVPAVPAPIPGGPAAPATGGGPRTAGVPLPPQPGSTGMIMLPPPTGSAPGAGEPGTLGGQPALPVGAGGAALAPERPSRYSAPTLQERAERATGFGGANTRSDPTLAARYAVNRSALAPANRSGGAPAASRTEGKGTLLGVGGNGGTPRLPPGTRVVASSAVEFPSATSGEPIEAVLEEPLVVHGQVLAPAGSHAYGVGGSFEDGTAVPRLTIRFTTFVGPDGEALELPNAVAYSTTDRRQGLVVPFNRQVLRKGRNILASVGLAAITQRISGGTRDETQGVYQPGVTADIRREALGDAVKTAKQELGLAQPATRLLFKLPEGTRFYLVFGLPGTGG